MGTKNELNKSKMKFKEEIKYSSLKNKYIKKIKKNSIKNRDQKNVYNKGNIKNTNRKIQFKNGAN